MKKQKTTRSEFVFFKDNKIANRFTLTIDELKEKYLAWLQTKEADWIMYYGHQTVVVFVTDKTGLSSTPEDQAYFRELEDILLDVRHTLPCYQS